MRMHNFAILCLILGVGSSCNSGNKLKQGEISRLESNQGSADSQIPLETQKVSVSNSEAAPVIVAEVPSLSGESDPDEDDDNKTASEPVPIGGAYLSCRYQNGQSQGNEAYRMDCEVAPAKDVTAPVVRAAFYKLDAQGQPSPLMVVTEDLAALKWTIQESMATMIQTQVQVVLEAPGFLATKLTTSISPTFSLVQNPRFWLGGEPNSLNADEDCVEIVPASGKISHQNFTGLVSGPLGRMNDNICSLEYNYLCRNISAGASAAKWTISASAGPFAEGALACGRGYAFSFPLNDAEAREVIGLIDSRDLKVWVNMSDRANEGAFALQFR